MGADTNVAVAVQIAIDAGPDALMRTWGGVHIRQAFKNAPFPRSVACGRSSLAPLPGPSKTLDPAARRMAIIHSLVYYSPRKGRMERTKRRIERGYKTTTHAISSLVVTVVPLPACTNKSGLPRC